MVAIKKSEKMNSFPKTFSLGDLPMTNFREVEAVPDQDLVQVGDREVIEDCDDGVVGIGEGWRLWKRFHSGRSIVKFI